VCRAGSCQIHFKGENFRSCLVAGRRALAGDQLPSAGTFWLLTARTVLWCAVMLGLYARLRRSRA
jgi:hypothetical protein